MGRKGGVSCFYREIWKRGEKEGRKLGGVGWVVG